MKIVQLTTIEGVHIPGVGQLPPTITTGPKAKFPGLTMEVMEGGHGIKVTVLGKIALIPWSNIKIALAEPSAKNS